MPQPSRYSRNIALAEIGQDGQDALLESKVLVIGAGGLGSPVIMYLAAAGVGTIGVVDSDKVDLSNLQRQVLFGTESIGKSKVSEAARRVKDLNPDVRVIEHKLRLEDKEQGIREEGKVSQTAGRGLACPPKPLGEGGYPRPYVHAILNGLHERVVGGIPLRQEASADRLTPDLPSGSSLPLNPDLSSVESSKFHIPYSIFQDYDLIADCSDNFTTRFLISDICLELKKPLVSGAVTGFAGQVAVFKPYLENQPCYRCFCPAPPPEDLLPNCSSGGVLGSVAGVIGSLQATEIIKELLHIGDDIVGNILIYDGLKGEFRKIKLNKAKGCVCNSTKMQIRS